MNAERAHSSSSNFIHAEILCRKGTIQRICMPEIDGKSGGHGTDRCFLKSLKMIFKLEQAQAAKPV
jgi:hypothetical protein